VALEEQMISPDVHAAIEALNDLVDLDIKNCRPPHAAEALEEIQQSISFRMLRLHFRKEGRRQTRKVSSTRSHAEREDFSAYVFDDEKERWW
jgi:hypothetical protein